MPDLQRGKLKLPKSGTVRCVQGPTVRRGPEVRLERTAPRHRAVPKIQVCSAGDQTLANNVS